jgi:hypothetical protein
MDNEKLHDLYASPNIIRVIRPRRMKWAEHVAPLEEMINAYIFIGKPDGKRPRGRTGVGERVILE